MGDAAIEWIDSRGEWYGSMEPSCYTLCGNGHGVAMMCGNDPRMASACPQEQAIRTRCMCVVGIIAALLHCTCHSSVPLLVAQYLVYVGCAAFRYCCCNVKQPAGTTAPKWALLRLTVLLRMGGNGPGNPKTNTVKRW